MKFTRVLKEVLWCLVTEGGISYRRIKLSFVLMTTLSRNFGTS
jgi:hypothetical protein